MASSRKNAQTTKDTPPKPSPATRPAATIRQGNLKCVIWRNESDKGPSYMADLVRTFKTESGFQDTSKVPADDLLRVAFLAEQAFGELQHLKAQDRAGRDEAPDESPQP